MQSRTVGLATSRLVMALSLALAGAGVWAQDTKAEDHAVHHPADAASTPKQAPKLTPRPAAKPAPAKAQPAAIDKGNMEKMGQMDSQMKAMNEMHQKFMATKTPEERMGLMPENMKAMQEAMSMMDDMRANTGDKSGMGMMGGTANYQMMEKRMEMMQSMMQMMIDRMQLPATK